MATRKPVFMVKGKKVDHLHLQDIPAKMIRSGSSSALHRDEVSLNMLSMQYTFEKLTIAAQVCYVNIESVTSDSPYMPSPNEVYRSVQEFVYHYENYGMRTFILREKLCLFINAVLPVEWPEAEVSIKTMLNHSTVRKAKLDKLLQKFNSQSENPLGELIKTRNQLTHKLYYPNTDHFLRPTGDFDNTDEADLDDWFVKWKKKVKEKETLVSQAQKELMDLNHELSEKIYIYKNRDDL